MFGIKSYELTRVMNLLVVSIHLKKETWTKTRGAIVPLLKIC